MLDFKGRLDLYHAHLWLRLKMCRKAKFYFVVYIFHIELQLKSLM